MQFEGERYSVEKDCWQTVPEIKLFKVPDVLKDSRVDDSHCSLQIKSTQVSHEIKPMVTSLIRG